MRNVHTFIHSLVSSGELSNRTNKQEKYKNYTTK